MLLDTFATAAMLLVFGAHVLVPARLATHTAARRSWSVACLPALGFAAGAALAVIALRPELALAVGWGEATFARYLGRALVVLIPALVLADLVVVVTWRRLEAPAWRILAGFALLPLALAAMTGELLHRGETATTLWPLLVGAAARCGVAVAVAEAVAPAPRSGRPWWSLAGGVGLPVHALSLAPGVAARLVDSGAVLTLGAGSLLLLAAPGLPRRLRRPAVGAGLLLAGLWMAQTARLALDAAIPTPPLPPLPVF